MLWRAVLTAIAISCTFLRENLLHVRGQGSPLIQIKDVICVLLLSGLQKEDLDANTMEKLRRHNVNIYDMNNESLRQECLLKSLFTAKSSQGLNLNDEKNDTSFLTIHQGSQGEVGNIPITHKPDIAIKNYFTNENLKTLMNVMKMKSVPVQQSQISPIILNETIMSKKNYRDNDQNQPNLESVLNFWSKLKQTGQTKAAFKTTTVIPIRKRIESKELLGTLLDDAKSELNSKELEYVNMMMSEYIGDNEPTTTKVTNTKSKNFEIITRKVSEIFGNKKQYTDVEPISFSQAMSAFTTKPNLESVIKINSNNHYVTADEVLPRQKELNYDNNELMNNNPKRALQYLSNMLDKNKKTNAPTTYLERSDQSPRNDKTYTQTVKRVPNSEYNVVNNTNNQAPVSSDVLQRIADMVKDIVMKDIRKEIPSTARSLDNVTEKPVTADKKGNEGNQMMQQMIALFKEYNSMQEPTSLPDRVTEHKVNTSTTYQHKPKLVSIPLGPAERALQGSLYLPSFKEKLAPITFQTNSGEIPPLAIQVSKPVIHQRIIVTSPHPLDKFKTEKYSTLQPQPQPSNQQHDSLPAHPQNDAEQTFENKYTEVLNLGSDLNTPLQYPTYADLTKKLRIAENLKNEFRDSYRLQKLKERIVNAREENRARQLSESLGTNNVAKNRHPKPRYEGLGHIVGSGHHDALSRHYNGHYPGAVHRAVDSSHQESLIDSHYANGHEPFTLDLDIHNNLNRPLGTGHHESFNHPVDLRYDALNRANDLNQRDIITREVLSRLVGSNQHDVISRLVEPSRQNVLNRPVDLNQQSRSHHSDAYERIEHEHTRPLFKGPRFHEELERIGQAPRNNQKSAPCCDIIAARQQMPIAKLKQHPKFDDAHFRNFLKSQQKVTDMLEKILAAKTKPKPQSVETP